MAWLTGWSYRRKLTVQGSSAGAQTNYQRLINLFYGSGTSTPPNLYFDKKCLQDFKDIRFTQDDGVTLIDHFIWKNYVWNLSKVGSFLVKGASGWDSSQVRQLGGVISGSRFHFWYGGYNGSNWQIGYGYSDDMLASTKGNYNPIISYNAYNAGDNEVRDPSVIKIGTTYFIYSQAHRSADDTYRIGLSKTTDPGGSSITHVGYVLSPGASGDFDDFWVASPALLQDSSETLYLFYEARKYVGSVYTIGLATSTDGETFTKQGTIKNIDGGDFVNPSGNYNAIVPITVVLVNGIYYMTVHYYTGSVWKAGILKSTNLTNWEWSQDAITEDSGTSPFIIKKDDVWYTYTEESGNANLNRWSNTVQTKGDGVIWAEIPEIPADPGTVDIYIYYGNASASETSNILNAFLKGEDGVNGNFDTKVSGTGAISRINEKYRFTEDSTDDVVLAGTILSDWNFLAQICEWQKVISFNGQIVFGLFDSDTVANLAGTSGVAGPKRRFLCQRVPGGFGATDTFYIVYQNTAGTFYFWNGTVWTTSSAGFSITSKFNVEIRVWSDGTNFLMDILRGGVSIMANPASIVISSVKAFSSGKCLVFGEPYTDAWWFGGWIDDYFLKKYVSPEPAWGSWGSEEEAAGETFYQALSAIGSCIASISQKFTWTKLLTATGVAVSILTRALSFYRSLPATGGSMTTLSRIATFYRVISAVGTYTALITKGFYKILSAIGSNIVSFSCSTTFYRTISAVGSNIANLVAQFIAGGETYYQALQTVGVSVVNISKVAAHYWILVVIGLGVTTLNKIATFYKTISATGSSIASITKGFYKTLTVVGSSIATLVAQLISGVITYYQALPVIGTGIVGLTKIATHYYVLIVAGIGTVTLGKIAAFYRMLNVTGTSAVELFKGLYKSLVGTGEGIATLTAGTTRKVYMLARSAGAAIYSVIGGDHIIKKV